MRNMTLKITTRGTFSRYTQEALSKWTCPEIQVIEGGRECRQCRLMRRTLTSWICYLMHSKLSEISQTSPKFLFKDGFLVFSFQPQGALWEGPINVIWRTYKFVPRLLQKGLGQYGDQPRGWRAILSHSVPTVVYFSISFSFDWEEITDTRDTVSSAIQTPRISSKILHRASSVKQCLSFLIDYLSMVFPLSIRQLEMKKNPLNSLGRDCVI